ncbi:hypothetical protein LB464_08330 [Escherichia coli]|uniref:hypothetical protein n=1 Tax=Escherichia coli TaxID=562 RepID=UPI003AB945B3|nr:hypothetical protein [Escherichia coli]
MPAIIELGTAPASNFELIDQGGLGHTALTQARNQLAGHGENSIRFSWLGTPNGWKIPLSSNWMFDQEKAQALAYRSPISMKTISAALADNTS